MLNSGHLLIAVYLIDMGIAYKSTSNLGDKDSGHLSTDRGRKQVP